MKHKAKKRLRKFCLWIGSVALLVLLIVALLPFWLPWILSPVLEKQGGRFSSYERVGWSRFELDALTYTNQSITFSAQHVEVQQPVSLLLRGLFNRSGNPVTPPVRVSDWNLKIHPAKDKPKSTNSIHSVSEVLDLVAQINPLINDWIAHVEVLDGSVHFMDQTLQIPEIRLRDNSLNLQVDSPDYGLNLSGTVSLLDDENIEAGFDVSPGPVHSEFAFTKENEAWLLNGNVNWLTNDFQVSATFDEDEWEPQVASITADSFSVPASLFGIEVFESLIGALAIQWRDQQAVFQVNASAIANTDRQIYVPDFAVNIGGFADKTIVAIEQLEISSPILSANLSAPLRVHPMERTLENPTTLTFQTDLENLPWIEATGLVSGEVEINPSDTLWPRVTFEIDGQNASAKEVTLENFEAEGEFDWPELRVRTVDVRFDENSSAQIDLFANVETREISEGNLRAITESDVISPFLPEEISFETVQIESQFSGPITNVAHRGSASVEQFQTTGTSEWDLSAEWSGTMLEQIQTSLVLVANESRIEAELSGGIDGNLEIGNATLTDNAGNQFTLLEPVTVSIPELKSGNAKTIAISPVQFEDGNGASLNLEGGISWPVQGDLSITGENLNSSWIHDFLETPPPPAHVSSLTANATWQEGPAEWSAAFEGGLESEKLEILSASLNASGSAGSANVSHLNVNFDSQPLLSAQGTFPFVIDLTNGESPIRLGNDEPVDGEVNFQEHPDFWNWISEQTGWTIANFQGGAKIKGSLNAPEAAFEFSAARVDSKMLNLATNIHLNVTDLSMSGTVTPNEFQLTSLNLDLEDQPISLSGRMPIPTGFWKLDSTNIVESLPLNEATAELRIDETSLASIAEYAPSFVSPAGSFSANLSLRTGFDLNGTIRLSGVSTRPISSIGRFQNTDLLLQLNGRRVSIEHFETALNDQPLTISGFLEIGDFWKLTDNLPQFEFHIEGKSVPVARRTGVMLRSDLDLNFTHEPGTPPRVSGNVNLRDSFFLADLDLLQFTSVATPEQRPPYFSIDIEPLSKFELDVNVVGDEFMQIRTPVFKGIASTDLQIGGTLKEPVALGDMRIDSGTIMFPFSNLFLEQGVITLSQANPYNPQLLVTATGRTYGFDIMATVSGTANEPTLTLSSTPPLTSEEILLMITAGTIPRDDFEYSSEQKASKLAFFLGKNLLQKFGSDKVTEEKLVIRSAEGISETGKVTYYVEYLLSPRWSLIGEYDEYNAVNAGLKFKIIHR